MKLRISASSLAGTLLCLCGSAAAQSSVAVYGVVDAGLTWESERHRAGSSTSLVSGGNSASRLGFRGSEELGQGWKALFVLESGFSLDDGALGQGGLLWGRKSFVGLSGPYGTLTLGRQDSPLYDYAAPMDPLSGALAFTRIFTQASKYRRDNNTIKYASPTLGGFKGQLAYSFGETAGTSASGRLLSAGLNYTRGASSSSLSMQNINSQAVGNNGIKTIRLVNLGTRYDFKVAAVSLMMQTNKSNEGAKAMDSRDFLAGVSVPLGAHKISASVMVHKDRKQSSGDARQLALGYTYGLSPRTHLYGGIAHISNNKRARFGLASLAEGGAPDGSDPMLYTAGVKHIF